MKLPELSEEEEIKFWDQHSVGDYWEDLAECNDTFKRPNLKTVTLKFDPLILQKIKMLAKKRGLPYSAYIRYLLSKSIEDEIMNRQSFEKM
ncbi:MAG: CopG family antitoxin [Thermodesulfobacteriota bacterium]|nr:CopG family antitoxin [Thermodesulfobacteriota bacterium]